MPKQTKNNCVTCVDCEIYFDLNKYGFQEYQSESHANKVYYRCLSCVEILENKNKNYVTDEKIGNKKKVKCFSANGGMYNLNEIMSIEQVKTENILENKMEINTRLTEKQIARIARIRNERKEKLNKKCGVCGETDDDYWTRDGVAHCEKCNTKWCADWEKADAIEESDDDEEEEEEEKCEQCGKTEQDCIDDGMMFDTGCLSVYAVDNRLLCPDCVPSDDTDEEEEEEEKQDECCGCHNKFFWRLLNYSSDDKGTLYCDDCMPEDCDSDDEEEEEEESDCCKNCEKPFNHPTKRNNELCDCVYNEDIIYTLDEWSKKCVKDNSASITQYFITNKIVMTTNNGRDKKEIPFIPFREFLLDVWNGLVTIDPQRCQSRFNDLISDLLLREIRILPREMKLACIDVAEGLINEIQDGFKKQKEQREKPKQKVNDPCACNSGKKYKKCCGNVNK